MIDVGFAIFSSPLIALCHCFAYRSKLSMMNATHSGHCRACKQRLNELLTAAFGHCRVNHAFPWPAESQAYRDSVIGAALEQIRSALAQFRNHREFIKSARLPPCDYVIAEPPFIVEFDESQHFSRARLIALNNYPANSQLGFPISRWQELCRQIDAKDDEPFDRDERRAWYDTLRELVPLVHGFYPTPRNLPGVLSTPPIRSTWRLSTD
jgi:hypothetical protein